MGGWISGVGASTHWNMRPYVQHANPVDLSRTNKPGEVEYIYLQYHEELRRAVIKKFDVCRTEAEDVVQTAFIRYSESSTSVENPRAFLYKTCFNIAVDQIRRRDVQRGYARSVMECVLAPVAEIGPERELDAHERLGIITRALWAMPGKRRQLLMMSRFDGLSYAEIARRVNLSETVVRKHIAKALAGCQRALQARDD